MAIANRARPDGWLVCGGAHGGGGRRRSLAPSPPIAIPAAATRSVACLAKKVADLEAQVADLTKETLKWNDRIALRNEDMRIFPRCLENPGPNTKGLTDVFANSCAKIPAQTWMIAKPYQ